jgi:hypothetical protein
MKDNFQCCFCGKTIETGPPDTGLLSYTTNFDGPGELQKTQHLFCHSVCLEGLLHPSAHLYILRLENETGAATRSSPEESA